MKLWTIPELHTSNFWWFLITNRVCKARQWACPRFICVPPITYYWTGLLILDHSHLVGNLTNSKIAETKALEPLKSWHFCISNFRTCLPVTRLNKLTHSCSHKRNRSSRHKIIHWQGRLPHTTSVRLTENRVYNATDSLLELERCTKNQRIDQKLGKRFENCPKYWIKCSDKIRRERVGYSRHQQLLVYCT